MAQVNVNLIYVALHSGLVEITDETIPVLIRVYQQRRHMNVRSLSACESMHKLRQNLHPSSGGPAVKFLVCFISSAGATGHHVETCERAIHS